MWNVELTGEFIAFFVFAVMIITGAVMMLSLTQVVHMVLSLLAAFIGMAGMFVLLQAEFLAFVQVLIYAGAVTILMIFGIMMTNHQGEGAEFPRAWHEGLAAVGALALFGLLFYAIRQADFSQVTAYAPAEDNTLAIGKLLFTGYVVPFELVSVLLTVAFIGAIVLAKKEAD
ncbi:NADH-quinone oxidoreductase subunit J [Paenibacillus phyllosphaerae]|uniref:NADH-quinone oxidoreductase subunit J n=1 Tax=Paenibacillus phyllosphaerae TaxID=274593 RepID=A0A7W5AXH3_9BACL|nr:NADH-quinone oxidoreductase subunit J [Paenibacillus phyllosphaerae]MBB3110543.1 NADH-quinone oxidoreductase subunit J [Paenibacillus phyllosphaerae]